MLRRISAAVLLCAIAAAGEPELNHRLSAGEKLKFDIDASRVLRKDIPQVRGISVHGLTGFKRHPYETGTGKYVLEAPVEEAIRDLHLPMSRTHLAFRKEDPFPWEKTVEMAAEMYGKFGIPHETVILTIPNESLDQPERCAALVRHSIEKGYRFHHWEMGNEPWHPTVPKSLFNEDPDVFIQRAVKVAAAIREVQQNALIVFPVHDEPENKWTVSVVQKAAGNYDCVAPHAYAFSRFYQCSFEGMTLAENWRILSHISTLNGMLRAANPGKDVYVYDSEWGQHSKGYDAHGQPKEPALGPTECIQNANILGTMHRAVRLIYYSREEFLRGASSWEMFTRANEPGFGILTRDEPAQRGMIYWLYYYFQRHVGPEILDITGTAPWFTATSAEHYKLTGGQKLSGPLTPVLASIDREKKVLYLIIANCSWNRTVHLEAALSKFEVHQTEGWVLSNGDLNAKPWISQREDLIGRLPVEITGGTIQAELPAHSVAFIALTTP